MDTVIDPHNVIFILQELRDDLKKSPYTINLLSLFGDEINSLIGHCKQILRDTYLQIMQKIKPKSTKNSS